jgi:tetratricopeptide (TPR) repeat protein
MKTERKASGSMTQDDSDVLIRLFKSGDYVESVKMAREITRRYPEDAFAWKVLGASLKLLDKLEDALMPMQRAVQLNPEDAEAYANLGAALNDLKRLEEAEASCRHAIRIKSDLAEAHSNLGNILREQGRLDEAAASCRQAIAINPDFAEAHLNLGATLYKLGRMSEAEASFRRMIALAPGDVRAYKNLGALLIDLGHMDEAKGCCQSLLILKQDDVEVHRSLAMLKKFTSDDPQIATLQQLYESVRDDTKRAHVCFALATAYEDLAKFDEAFALYTEGNSLRKKELGYTIEQDRVLFNAIKSQFHERCMVSPEPLRTKKPILIIGMPRSGTSLVEQILASHTDVFGAGELEELGLQVQKHFLGVDADGFDLAKASRKIASGYLESLDRMGTWRRFITDKMPLNFRWLGFLLLALPDIKVIHTIRDPMAVCWSSFKRYFPEEGMKFLYDQNDLAEYYRMYEDLMQFWRERFPGRIYDLDYERLTENQEEETRKLLAYCGLPWQDRCLEFEKTERAVRTASATQVRKKMYKGSSEAWRKFERHLGPLLEGLGRETSASTDNSSTP